MNANELADMLERMTTGWFDDLTLTQSATMLRQQQAEIEDLNKENTDLRYLIATKLEQQDGISLNSMAHPITNTPEPSYEIDPDKLETIEIDLPSPEPVAWMSEVEGGTMYTNYEYPESIPLYTHPVKEQLTDEEITACMGFLPKYNSEIVDEDLVNFARAILRKAQENGNV